MQLQYTSLLSFQHDSLVYRTSRTVNHKLSTGAISGEEVREWITTAEEIAKNFKWIAKSSKAGKVEIKTHVRSTTRAASSTQSFFAILIINLSLLG